MRILATYYTLPALVECVSAAQFVFDLVWGMTHLIFNVIQTSTTRNATKKPFIYLVGFTIE